MWMVLYMAFLSLLFSCTQCICYKWQSFKSREQVTLHCLYVCHCLFLIVDWVNRTILVANFCFGFQKGKALEGQLELIEATLKLKFVDTIPQIIFVSFMQSILIKSCEGQFSISVCCLCLQMCVLLYMLYIFLPCTDIT